MPIHESKLDACRTERGAVVQPEAAAMRGRIQRRHAGASMVRLARQAGDELTALGAMLASKGDDETLLARQLAAVARTIVRIGSQARSLELDFERMRHCAYHDALTGLPNRSLLLDRLDRALAHAARHGGHVALLMLDVDDFKLVNDRFGHAVGDRILQGVASRLQMATRDADTICRYGGDEFVVLIPDADGREGPAIVARKIQSCLAAPLRVDGHAIALSACIGLAVYPEDGIAAMHLLQRADAAMYGAKDNSARPCRAGDGERLPGSSTRYRARRMLEVVAGSGAPRTADPSATPTGAAFDRPRAGAAARIRRRAGE